MERLSTPQVFWPHSLSHCPVHSSPSLAEHLTSSARPMRSLPLSFPFIYSSHCLYSVLTASTKTRVGTGMYINSPPHSHCRGQPILRSFSLLFKVLRVCVRPLFLFSRFPFSFCLPSPWVDIFLIAATATTLWRYPHPAVADGRKALASSFTRLMRSSDGHRAQMWMIEIKGRSVALTLSS